LRQNIFKSRIALEADPSLEEIPTMGKVICEALVEGGKASAGPPIAPVLGPTGANLFQIVQEINKQTEDLKGLKVPVTIVVDDDTKEFEITIGLPPTSALIVKEVGVEKGTGATGTEITGDISFDQVLKVARAKEQDLLGSSLGNRVKSVLGTCVSMGVTVDGKDARMVQQEIDEGAFADQLQG
jgi:large subunit ribosomal protein L11